MTNVPPIAVPLQAPVTAQQNFETEAEALESFEAVFLSQMVDEMMKTVDMDKTMGGHAAEMWRSVLSQALADSLVESGGFSIAENIQNNLNAYKTVVGEGDV